jgi:DNA polymerase III subunit chi
MTELLFYHLQGRRLEGALPPLLEKSLERGWRVVVQVGSAERIEALDAHLWTYRDDSFLPHGVGRDHDGGEQPILLTLGEDNPNRAHVRFLVDGVDIPSDAADYQRIVVLFDGDDPDAVAAARARWQDARAKGFAVTYWRQDPQGRWERQADGGTAAPDG